ncbi:MAG: hypothetical protein Q7J35_02315 [Candidatus Methanoperedens sp.]|nr:hypothetical protein [Candidatus Methanoperedens sp.]
MKLVIKSNEVSVAGVDIHGRAEALDQSLRSVDGRLRAVERRLSYKSTVGSGEQSPKLEYDINEEIEGLIKQISVLAKSVDDMKNAMRSEILAEIEGKLNNTQAGVTDLIETNRIIDQKLKALSETERRIFKLENANKISIGKIKVPLELSGLVASIVLIVTGLLIFADKWNIIRSSYYPATIGIIFGAVVIIKFIMTNRETG